ncbi:MAG: alpha/beta hydrolase [Candidatus Cyclobacteriaceae bacterium M3_2C_046]
MSKIFLLALIFAISFQPYLYSQSADEAYYEKYYKPTSLKRWYIAPGEGPLVGTQQGRYLGPQDLLPGRFQLNGKVKPVQPGTFDLIQGNCAWGKYTYRFSPADQINLEKSPKTTPLAAKLVLSQHIKLAEVPLVQHELQITGTIKQILAENTTFLVELDFTGDQVIPFEMTLVKSEDEKRSPELRGLRYGPHWKHAIDIYYPRQKPEKPMAAIVFIHGGGWSALDKAARGKDAQWYNDHGLAYISINYRYVSMHEEHPAVEPPVAASLLDAARAVQLIRYKAETLNIDPDRLGFTGGSAGGATCTWLALHDDLAHPNHPDPVARMSTKPGCTVPVQAQTSIDPRLMKQWIPGITYGAHAFFDRSILPSEDRERFQFFLNRRKEILPWIEEFSPYRHASADDPPILLNYLMRKNTIPSEDKGHATHHPRFGAELHEKLKALQVESHFICDDDIRSDQYKNWYGVKLFFIEKLHAQDEAGL